MPLLSEAKHADSVVERAQGWLRKNMALDISMSDLARAVAASDRTLTDGSGRPSGSRRLAIFRLCVWSPRARCLSLAT